VIIAEDDESTGAEVERFLPSWRRYLMIGSQRVPEGDLEER
jgi:hypothetical protein